MTEGITNAEQRLLKAAVADRLADSAGSVLRMLDNPQFDRADRVHEWRNHIDDDVKGVWDELPLSAKLVAFLRAAVCARSEEWE